MKFVMRVGGVRSSVVVVVEEGERGNSGVSVNKSTSILGCLPAGFEYGAATVAALLGAPLRRRLDGRPGDTQPPFVTYHNR